MNALPYYKRFPRDFLEGTVGMPFEEKGAYGIVIDLIYLQDGSLADDSGYISGHLGMSVRKWNSIRERLINRGKLQVNDGIISTKRSDNLMLETRKLRDKNAENGAKSHENNILEGANADKARDKPEPESEPEREETTTTPRTEVVPAETKSGGGGPPDLPSIPDQSVQTRLVAAVGQDASFGFSDMLEARRWSSELGLSFDEQTAVIAEVVATKRDGAPNSLKFFSKAMQRAVGIKKQPELAPTTANPDPSAQPQRTLAEIFASIHEETSEGAE
ncbi:DUF1376 domain-containing protein [Falsihalocynthiibacter arcticus]|uniref:DUF1376 domain-containing protein n=1 Tax=Falsihalocynthiibacter arcticus TaxID=1579316 RepID=UPI0030022C39